MTTKQVFDRRVWLASLRVGDKVIEINGESIGTIFAITDDKIVVEQDNDIMMYNKDGKQCYSTADTDYYYVLAPWSQEAEDQFRSNAIRYDLQHKVNGIDFERLSNEDLISIYQIVYKKEYRYNLPL